MGRRWVWPVGELRQAAVTFDELGLDLVDPALAAVADWMVTGLSAYDAAYVAVAQELRIPLVTANARILAAAGEIAVPLAKV